ncbi:hypothetical protein ACH0B5_15305 [Ureibacillus sp. 179-F W5.1 NHS]|uniref:hypothetical protein n=1 Tax=Ureibacillus sp. 179-F W5.1 NHS TaxID=3374297 RepID=UPI003879F0A9
MKFHHAKHLLRKALKEQKTIQVEKLKEILQSMHFSIDTLDYEMKIVKTKDGKPTVIEYGGQRFVKDFGKRGK